MTDKYRFFRFQLKFELNNYFRNDECSVIKLREYRCSLPANEAKKVENIICNEIQNST